MIDYASIILHALILGTFLALYWKAGQLETPASNTTSLLWCFLSFAAFLLTWFYLGFGYLSLILAQLALALLIALFRAACSLLPSRKDA